MIRRQRWRPDTCADPTTGDVCSFIEEWDDTVDPVSRTHTFVQRENVCSFHKSLDDQDGFNVAYSENIRKNMTFNILKSIDPNFKHEDFVWRYDNNGVLSVDINEKLVLESKQELQTSCDIQFGPGKVVIS